MFTFNTTPSLIVGEGTAKSIGPIARDRLGARIFIVTDAGLVKAGLIAPVLESLEQSGVSYELFTDVVADPPDHLVLQAAEQARSSGVTGIIGFGGGSSLDVAKLVALLTEGAQNLGDIYGVGKAKGPRLPLMLVPTTAGTGSEVTPISIVTTGKAEKMGVVSPILLPDIALCDAELTYGLPPAITAATGIDAMVHAIEAHASASANNNPVSRALAREALRLMGGALERAVHDGRHDKAARADMLLGSLLAGQAFANSPVAAVHALAHPLGGHFHIPHGLSNALVLAHVIRFNAETQPEAYADLAPILFPHLASLDIRERASGFADELAALGARCGLAMRLRDHGIGADVLPLLAKDAMNQTRLLINNPRPLSQADALAIYQAAY